MFFTQAGEFGGTELYSWTPQLGDTSTIVQISFATNNANTNPSNINVLGSHALFTGQYNGSYNNNVLEYNGTSIILHENMDMRGSILFDGVLYFLGWNSEFGGEVWTYDGTNLDRLTDLVSGNGSGEPNEFTIMDGNLYFSGFYGNSGRILLKLNGSDATVITGGPTGQGVMPSTITAVGSKLYVTYSSDSELDELWMTAGVSLTHIDSLPPVMPSWAFSIAALGTDLYYTTSVASYSSELVRVNTTNNTVTAMITNNVANQGSSANSFVTFKGKMYFQAYTPTLGSELYSYNGVNSPTLPLDINPGTGYGPAWRDPVVVGNNMYFTADDGVNGSELWVYDGTASNAPHMVSDQSPGPDSSDPSNLTEVNGSLYYTTNDGTIWKLAANGDRTLVEIDSENIYPSKWPQYLTAFDNKLYFSVVYQADGALPAGNLLFVTDGSSPAVLVTEPESALTEVSDLMATPNYLYFAAKSVSENTGVEMYRLGKNNSQPVRITDIELGADSSYPIGLGYFNSLFYFKVQSATGGLYTANEAGDIAQIEITDGQGSNPRSMTSIGNTVYWIGQSEAGNPYTSKYAVWSQKPGEQPVNESETYRLLGMDYFPTMAVFDGHLYFTADDEVHGREIFKLGANSVVQRINVSRNLNGFKAKKSVLSTAMKNSIRAFVRANPSATIAKCVGQTAVGKKTTAEKKLAKARATAVCAYAATVHRGIGKSVSTATGKKAGKAFNRVVLTLKS